MDPLKTPLLRNPLIKMKMRILLIAALVLPVILLSGCNEEDLTLAIRGDVMDANGDPVSNAKVVMTYTILSDNKAKLPDDTIQFSLPKEENVSIEIRGAHADTLVRSLANRTMQSGNHSIAWDHRTNDSLLVKSGMYSVVIDAESFDSKYNLFVNIEDYTQYSFDEIVAYATTDEEGTFKIEGMDMIAGFPHIKVGPEENEVLLNNRVTLWAVHEENGIATNKHFFYDPMSPDAQNADISYGE